MKKRKAAVDTSVFIAAVCAWHEKHAATRVVIDELLDAGAALILPGHAVLESYSVLTRLPAPHRLTPDDALALLERNAAVFAEGPGATNVRKLLGEWSPQRVAGGRIYDLYILESARRAGADTFVTLNAKDVAGFEGNLRIVVP